MSIIKIQTRNIGSRVSSRLLASLFKSDGTLTEPGEKTKLFYDLCKDIEYCGEQSLHIAYCHLEVLPHLERSPRLVRLPV